MKLIALVFLILGLHSIPALAAEFNSGCGSIQLAYYELGALYYHHADGSYAGIDKDVVEEVSKRSGCKFETVLESRVRIWAQLKNNTLDMSVSGIPTPEREKFAEFIPYFSTRNYVLLHRDMPAHGLSMAGFLADANLKVGIIKSFKHGPQFDEWVDKLWGQKRVHEASDFDSLLRLFLAKRVDAIMVLPTVWEPLLKKEDINKQIQLLDWAPQDSIVHGLIISRERISKTRRDLMKKAIYSMADDGTLEQIFSRHVGNKLAREMRYEGPRY
ncbi:substrate-binding periplasmic protein [Undibacterium pigrum]|uniref:Amino acid ABC transporter substrate-binding protein (PAAT family) n=1 Tax=Undibacterium pigrum TaxID=401470 RepID=A0A318IS75_9BURK|nr:transporter substrate-binding domain-containing protein [Undibacterium pigrum]PXX37863.1 amino acid ABC transporter substrate-binding protein (PAAT family) [Undibacterium pigrum]